MKILITAEHYLPKLGGVEKSIHSIAKSFADKGHDVTILTRRFSINLPMYEKNDFEIVRYDCRLSTKNIFYANKLYKFLINYFKTFNLFDYDLIIVRDSVSACAINKYRTKNVIYIPAAFIIRQFDGFGLKLGFRQNLRLFFRYLRFHGFLKYEKKSLKDIKHVVTYSKNMKKQVQRYTKNEVVINHPGLPNKISKSNEKLKLKGRVKFLYLGRLVAFKNIDMIIKAFDLLDFEDAYLYIVGDGDQRDILKAIKNKAKNKSHIIFVGQVENVQDYYSSSTFSITASNYETFGFNILESLYYGTPVLGFGEKCAAVAFDEMVKDEINGFIINEFSIDSLRDTLIKAYNYSKSDAYLNMRMAAEEISLEYNWDNFIEKLIKLGSEDSDKKNFI